MYKLYVDNKYREDLSVFTFNDKGKARVADLALKMFETSGMTRCMPVRIMRNDKVVWELLKSDFSVDVNAFEALKALSKQG